MGNELASCNMYPFEIIYDDLLSVTIAEDTSTCLLGNFTIKMLVLEFPLRFIVSFTGFINVTFSLLMHVWTLYVKLYG